MKNKLFAIVLSILMILSTVPASAVGIISVENSDEISTVIDTASEAALSSTAEFPASAPENAILYEDFETCTVTSGATEFTYADQEHAGTQVNAGEQWPTGLNEAPVSNGKSWFIDANNGSQGASSISIKNLSISEIGTYKISYKLYADFDQGTFGDLKHFIRVGNPDFNTGNFFDTTWAKENTTKSWVTKSYTFDIYMNNGVKYIKSCDNDSSQPLNGALFLRIYCFLGVKPTKDNSAPIYFDDLCVEKLSPVFVSFADMNGEEFDYEVPSQNGSVTVVMPTSTELGLSYEPKFTNEDGVEYVPGEPVTVTKNTVFTVSKSDIVLKDNFDSQALTGYKATLPLAYARDNFSNAHILHAKIFKYEHAEGNAFRQDAVKSGGQTPVIANDISFAAPGKYTITFEAGIDSDDFQAAESGAETTVTATSFNIWCRGNNKYDLKGSSASISGANPTAKLTYTVEVYERAEDGVLCFRDTSDNEVEASAVSSIRPAMTAVYPEGTVANDQAKHYIYIDSFMVKYEPYAPTVLKLASYKPAADEEDNSGIRFASYVSDSQKENCTELGYIVTRKSFIETDGVADYSKVTLDGINSVSYKDTTSGINAYGITVVAKAAYNGSSMKVFAKDGSVFNSSLRGVYETFFTGLLVGITDNAKDYVFVARPYAKVNGVYYYGECHETSYNEVYNKANA